MSQIPRETVLQAVLPILSEAFAGPANAAYPLGALRQIARHARHARTRVQAAAA